MASSEQAAAPPLLHRAAADAVREGKVAAAYGGLNKAQRKAANVLLRNAAGISWREALAHAEETTWRSLEKKGLAFFLPSSGEPERVSAALEHRFILGYREGRAASLLDALSGYRAQVLSLMCARLRLPSEGPRWRLGAAIAEAARSGLTERLRGLNAPERDILERVIDAGDAGVSIGDLGLETGRRSSWIPWSAPSSDFMLAPPPQAAPLHSLILQGLVVFQDRRLAFEQDPTRDTPLYAVEEVRAALAGPGTRPVETDPPESSASHADSLLRDLARLLTASLSCPVELLGHAQDQMGKTSLKKLAALLRMDDAARLERLAAFLFQQGAMGVAPSGVLLAVQSPRAAAEAAAKAYAKAVPAWRSDLDEKKRRSLRHFQALPKPDPVRAELVRRLAALPDGAWAATEPLADSIALDGAFCRELARMGWWLGRTAGERRAVLRQFLADELRVLFDFGAVEADAGLGKARRTPLLGLLARGGAPQVPPELADDGMGVVVQPNLEVLAPLGLPLADQSVLAAAGALKSVEHMALYAFTLETLYAGAGRGVGAKVLRATLARLSKGPLPRAFEALLAEFEARAGEIVVIPAPVLVRLRRPELGKVLQAAVGAEPLEGAPGYYCVRVRDGETLEGLMKALRRKGHMPLVDDRFLPQPGSAEDLP